MPVAASQGVQLQTAVGEKFAPLYSPYRHKALYGGRGSAKSHSIAEAIVIISANTHKRVVGARQYQNSIRDSSKSLIENKIKKLGLAKKFWIGRSEIICRDTDSRFTFIGLERNPDSARSLEGCDICWVEEARNISQDSMNTLIPTIRKKGSEIWWSWNPVDPNDPVDQLFRGKVPPRNAYIQRVGYEDNPWFFETEMPDEMLRERMANFERYQHIWLGEYYNISDSRIFNNVEVGRVDVPESAVPQFGLDFGFANDPNALIKLYVLEETRTIYIARENFGKVSLKDLPAFLKEVPGTTHYPIVADSARPETIDYLCSEGFDVVASRKGPGSIKAGIEWLNGYRIVIDPFCVRMEEEGRLYSWKKEKLTGKVLVGHPCDDYNHGWDAIRYATEVNRSGDQVEMTEARI